MWSFFLRLIGIAGFLAFCAVATLLVVNRTPATKTADGDGRAASTDSKAELRPLVPPDLSLLTRDRIGTDQPSDSATRFSRDALADRMAVGFQPLEKPALRGTDKVVEQVGSSKPMPTAVAATNEDPCSRLGFTIPPDRFTLRAGLLQREGGADPSKRVMVGEAQWQARLSDEPSGCRLIVEGTIGVADVATSTLRLTYGALPKAPVLLEAVVDEAQFKPAGALVSEPPRVRLSGGVPSVAIPSEVAEASVQRIAIRFDPRAGEMRKPDVMTMHWIDFPATYDGIPFVLTAELPDAMILLGQKSRRIDPDAGPPITGSTPDASGAIDPDAATAVETEPLSGNP